MHNTIYFWGCQVPARFPFIEKATRAVLERLNIPALDIDGFTCCPEKSLVTNLDEYTWYLTAARNLALAEKNSGKTLLTPCNGCYSTFKSVQAKLHSDPLLCQKINQDLARIDLTYTGQIKVQHVVEFFSDTIGLDKLKAHQKSPLWGMNIATHHGCHLLRPSGAIRFDAPFSPTKFDSLVESLGAKSPNFNTKFLCCGEALGRTGDTEQGVILARQKLLEVNSLKIDAIAVSCPACYLQFDTQQALLRKKGDPFNTPVFHISELVGLNLGISPEELGLNMHRVKVDRFLADWEKRRSVLELIQQCFSLESLQRCSNCAACENDCPSALNVPNFSPQAIIADILAGNIESYLETKDIWNCVECHTCTELCPSHFGMEKVFKALKRLAITKQRAPSGINNMTQVFLKTARLGEPQKSSRRKLKLPEACASGADDWKKLMELCGKKEDK